MMTVNSSNQIRKAWDVIISDGKFVHATHKGVIWREKQRRARTPIKVNDATQKRRENFHEQTEREKNDKIAKYIPLN